jgi:uncharacterized protein (DUF433 family)
MVGTRFPEPAQTPRPTAEVTYASLRVLRGGFNTVSPYLTAQTTVQGLGIAQRWFSLESSSTTALTSTHAPLRDTPWYIRRMSDHFTLRFQSGVSERLAAQARRVGLAPRTLAQRLVDEGLRREDHPLIRFVDGPSGRRAALVGSGLDVWEVIDTIRHNDNDPEEAAAYLEIAPRLVQAAVAYYGEYREEIDAEIALNEAESERGYAAWVAGQQALAS